jgi:Carboxypeptidase regulatory-like domain
MLHLCTCALIFIIGAPGLLRAQTAATFPVGGVVQDQTGGVLLNAVVELVRGAAAEQTATTDATGTFRFENVRGGSYEHRIRAEGFSPSFSCRSASKF